MRALRRLSILLLILASGAGCVSDREKIVPGALAKMAEQEVSIGFRHVRDNAQTEGIRRQVYQFEVDGLKQYALVLWPAGDAPPRGWPVVQFNHGYHPDPPRNGFNARGESDRPGDYYRETVQVFAREGYVVVAPDYRGHNVSEGGEFTSRLVADAWYSRDAIACFLALPSLPGLDMSRAYMLGHSMGGAVTLRASAALGERITAAAIWSTSGNRYVSDERSPFYRLEELPVPLSIHHAQGDSATPADNSRAVFQRLQAAERDVQLTIFPGDDHLFSGDDFSQAVATDLAWFRRH